MLKRSARGRSKSSKYSRRITYYYLASKKLHSFSRKIPNKLEILEKQRVTHTHAQQEHTQSEINLATQRKRKGKISVTESQNNPNKINACCCFNRERALAKFPLP